MTPEEQATIEENLREVAEILYKNTSSKELTSFETIELSVREQLQETVAPEISNLSWCAFPRSGDPTRVAPLVIAQQEGTPQEENEKFKPVPEK